MDPKIATGENGCKSCRLPSTVGLATGTMCIAGFDEHHSRMVQRAHVRPLINEYIMTKYFPRFQLSLIDANAPDDNHSQSNPDCPGGELGQPASLKTGSQIIDHAITENLVYSNLLSCHCKDI